MLYSLKAVLLKSDVKDWVMQSALAVLRLFGVSAAHPALIAVTGAAFATLAFTIFRKPLARLRLFDTSESESIMNFSSLGTLRCVCGAAYQEGLAPNRRRFCRICGCEVVKQNREMLEKRLTPREIEQLTLRLRRAAIRSRSLELPPSITDIDELHRFLGSYEDIPSRNVPPPTSVKQSRAH
jgi:hypothetical protein